jgi:hypothetical protein
MGKHLDGKLYPVLHTGKTALRRAASVFAQ